MAKKADHRWLLLVRQHLGVRQSRGVVDGNMDFVVADAVGAALLPVAVDAVPQLAEPGQGFHVDLDQVAWPVPFVTLHRGFVLQVSQTAHTQTAETSGDGGEGGLE